MSIFLSYKQVWSNKGNPADRYAPADFVDGAVTIREEKNIRPRPISGAELALTPALCWAAIKKRNKN